MAKAAAPREHFLADQMLRIVQLVFGVVIASSLTTYKDVVIDPLSDAHRVAALALLAVYLTAVLSWMGWHATMERYPYMYYKDGTRDISVNEHFRVFSDLAVVILYAYVLFRIELLKTTPSADITPMLVGYPLIFAFYLLSGHLRIKAYDRRASRVLPLLAGFVVFLALVVAYGVARASFSTATHTWLNAGGLVLVMALTITYRIFTERQRRRPGGRPVSPEGGGRAQ